MITYINPPNYWVSDHNPTASETTDTGDIALYDILYNTVLGTGWLNVAPTPSALAWFKLEFSIAEGSVTLSAGSATVSLASLASSNKIQLLYDSTGANAGAVYVSSRTDGVGFDISSTNVLDDSTIRYVIMN